MSYSIVYNRIVVRSDSGYTFLVLIGDNNVYDANNRRRSRDWSCLTHGKNEQEILDYFQSCCGNKYQEHFMLHGKMIDDAALMRWAKSGIKNAHSVEEVVDATNVALHCYMVYSADDSCELPDGIESTASYGVWRRTLDEYIKTTAEFDAWLHKAENMKEYLKRKNIDAYREIDVCTEKLSFPKNKNPITGKVLIKRGKYFIEDIHENGYSCTGNVHAAKVFDTYEEACIAVDQLKKSNNRKQCMLLSADKAFKRDADKKYVIEIHDRHGYLEGYFVRCTKRGYRYTHYKTIAARFTEKEAKKKIAEVFWGDGYTAVPSEFVKGKEDE